MQGDATDELRQAIADFKAARQLEIKPENRIPALFDRLDQIDELVRRIDTNALGEVPQLVLKEVARIIRHATEPITDFLVHAFSSDDKNVSDSHVVPPLKWRRNPENIAERQQVLESLEAQLFTTAQSIFLHQEVRTLQLVAAVPINVDDSKSAAASNEDTVVWRYMPLRNFKRSIIRCGLWMSSIERLRKWSKDTARDTFEGNVPPVLADLAADFRRATNDPEFAVEFLRKYGLSASGSILSRLHRVIDRIPDHSRVFSCSWSAKEEECPLMWEAYGDHRRGVALKTTIGKLRAGPWRTPVTLLGMAGGPALHGLMLRKIRYLRFDTSDNLSGSEPEDFYTPFIKRTLFESEREWRLLALSTRPLDEGGLTIQCDLSALVNEIVIGPSADAGELRELIAEFSPNLLDTPTRNSALSER